MVAPPDAPPSALVRAALTLVFVCFVVGWLAVGIRGLEDDDSRWAWGMFPYVLEVQVREVRFVDAAGTTRRFQPHGPVRLPRAVRPGVKDETWGYGKGAWDDLVRRLLRAAARDARADDVAVEAVVRTRRSERSPVDEIIRRELP